MNDEPVSWKYYLATGIASMIACFLSAVQGETSIFFRVREVLVMLVRTDVHPLWVFVPAFLLGMAACWVERPRSSRSVLIAGLASFSLFSFAPYSSGKNVLEGRSKDLAGDNLQLDIQGFEAEQDVSLIIRDANFQIVQRLLLVRDQMSFRLMPTGQYWLEVTGDPYYRNVVYPITIGDEALALRVVLEKVGGWRGFMQKFMPAVREGRQPSG